MGPSRPGAKINQGLRKIEDEMIQPNLMKN